MIGALAMSFSSIFVVLNALRLRGFKPGKEGRRKKLIQETSSLRVDDLITAGITDRACPVIPGLEEEEGTMDKEMVLEVEGMTCGHCTARVEKALKAMPGVGDAHADLETKRVTVKTDGNVSLEAVTQAITDEGYQVVG
jgi:copper ion binding protein